MGSKGGREIVFVYGRESYVVGGSHVRDFVEGLSSARWVYG